MKKYIFIIALLIIPFLTLHSQSKTNYYNYNYKPLPTIEFVKPFVKSNGTFIEGYFKTKKDDSFWNNFSSYGNYNYFTGKKGYKRPKHKSNY